MRRVLSLEVAEVGQGLISLAFHSGYIGEPLRGLITPGDIYDLTTSLVTRRKEV